MVWRWSRSVEPPALIVVVFAAPDLVERRLVHGEMSTHPHMHYQRFTTIEVHHDVLRPAPQPLHPAAGQAVFKIIRKWDAEVRSSCFNIRQQAAFDDGLQAALDDFNFG